MKSESTYCLLKLVRNQRLKLQDEIQDYLQGNTNSLYRRKKIKKTKIRKE